MMRKYIAIDVFDEETLFLILAIPPRRNEHPVACTIFNDSP
jgi:hypothetical protein